jgi:hypothetical protein
MKRTGLPQLHEQRKIEALLLKLAKMNPISAKPAPIVFGKSAIQAACSANSQVFFST